MSYKGKVIGLKPINLSTGKTKFEVTLDFGESGQRTYDCWKDDLSEGQIVSFDLKNPSDPKYKSTMINVVVVEGEASQPSSEPGQQQSSQNTGGKRYPPSDPKRFERWYADLKAHIQNPANEEGIRGILGGITEAQALIALGKMLQHIKQLKDTKTSATQTNVLNCTFDSFLDVMVRVVEMDIPFGDGRLYLIPYGTTLTLSVGYLGMVYKIRQADPSIKAIDTVLIFKGQTWSVGQNENGAFLSVSGHGVAAPDYSNVEACVCLFRQQIGNTLFCTAEVLPKADLDTIRSKSQMNSGGPWKDFTGEMYKKASVRRAAKPYLQGALALDSSVQRMIDTDNSQFELSRPSFESQPEAKEEQRQFLLSAIKETADFMEADTLLKCEEILSERREHGYGFVEQQIELARGGDGQ
jgi:recombinational DNA repair protein RecT